MTKKLKNSSIHHTKGKGDLAVAFVIADLTKKGYVIFTPTISDHLAFDLIAYKNGVSKRIQVKYHSIATGQWKDKSIRIVAKYYKESNYFDYYAIYCPNTNSIYYPSISFAGKHITLEVPNSAMPFHWHEDFVDFTDEIKLKTYRDFGKVITLTMTPARKKYASSLRKLPTISKSKLNKLLWKYPASTLAKLFKVSGSQIASWAKQYSLKTPGRGYWGRGGKRLP